jgi:ubiquinone/menaquinone biosynthesis C-methylase UbiE
VTSADSSRATAAQHFADSVVDAVFAVWATDLVERARLQPGERVLDVGCGTGAVARAAAPVVGRTGSVVGVDTSAERLTVASALPPVVGPTIEWRQADAASLPFPEASFNAVLCQQVLHLVRDRAAALSEMRRVLAPGGRVAISVWQSMEHSPAFVPIARAVTTHLGSEEGQRFGRNFSLADEATLRRLIEAAGFAHVVIVQETKIADFATPDDFITYQMGVNRDRWNTTEAIVNAIIAETREGLDPWVENGRLRFPRGAHIATARRL